MSLEKTTYDAGTGTVLYRSKMHPARPEEELPDHARCPVELLCRHIPDRYEHLVRYLGWYSNRARRASEAAEGATDGEHVHGGAQARERIRRACQGRLGGG